MGRACNALLHPPLTSLLSVSVAPPTFPQVSQWYELVVFTASMEIYGSAVADKLDNNRSILKRRYYRQVGLVCPPVAVGWGKRKDPL